jgi:hypothetical protein
MKTITIGRYGRSQRCDRTVQYNQVITKIKSGANTTRPEFCVELRGGDYTASIYAASEAAFNHIKRILATGSTRMVPGPEVLGIHIQGPPSGWPRETVGITRVRRAPNAIIASASAALADAPATRYPLRTTPGVEVIGYNPAELIRFAPYHEDDSITMQNRNVLVRFATKNRDMSALHVVTADADLAQSLAASIARKTPRRLMVNTAVRGMSLMLPNGTKVSLGDLTSPPTAAK